MTGSTKHIINKLLGSRRRISAFAATAVLFVGITLLLLSVLVWWNFSLLLADERQDNHATFFVVGKNITEQNMASDNTFSATELAEIRQTTGVIDAGVVTPALFPAYATLGGAVAMATDLPLESVADKFLDTIPPGWGWRPGQRELPILVSSSFFDIYNYVFAPGQGLPQLSHKSATMLTLKLQVGGAAGGAYSAHVVGFTGRFGSVLVPQSFIEYSNRLYAPAIEARPSQIVIHVADPAEEKLNSLFRQKGYSINAHNLRWAKLRQIVSVVTATSGIIAFLLTAISGLVFSLFIQLTLARAQQSLILLRQIGYSAVFLRRVVYRRIFPLTAVAFTVAVAVALLVQFFAGRAAKVHQLNLPFLPGWPVWTVAGSAAMLLALWLWVTTRNLIRE